jgi:hypothetical protein
MHAQQMEVISCEVLLLGLHKENDAKDVRSGRGKIDLPAGTSVNLNRDPRFHMNDPLAVNVLASEGPIAGTILGHVAVDYANPCDAMHTIAAIMDGNLARLPPPLQIEHIATRVSFTALLQEKTTHRPTGSRMVITLCLPSPVDMVLVGDLYAFLSGGGTTMIVQRLV